MIGIRDRYWVLHEQDIVRALERVADGDITPEEAIADLEEHSTSEEIEDGR